MNPELKQMYVYLRGRRTPQETPPKGIMWLVLMLLRDFDRRLRQLER